VREFVLGVEESPGQGCRYSARSEPRGGAAPRPAAPARNAQRARSIGVRGDPQAERIAAPELHAHDDRLPASAFASVIW